MNRSREYAATVTRQGQVTVPAELRRELGIDGGGRVRFVVDDTGVRFEPEPSVADLFGVLPALQGTSDDFDREIEEAISAALEEKYGRNANR
jgi:AbrB family looped-hinge helix DNA binding protein